MKVLNITLPELILVVGTRAMLGVGVGLLVSDHLEASKRTAIGWTLLLIGALSTIPLGMEILGKPSAALPAATT